jgi:hypothetical protein
MKYSALGMFSLLLALASEPSLAQTQPLFPDSLDVGGGVICSNLFQEFESRLRAAVEGRDLVAIQRLYQTNGVAEETLKFELGRWKQLLDENTNVRPGLWFKELATLPPKARLHWTEYAHRLTDREVTHLCFLAFSPGNVVQLGLPLVVVDDRFLIVPSEKRSMASRIEQDGAANGSQPIRPETNRTSVAAGSRR